MVLKLGLGLYGVLLLAYVLKSRREGSLKSLKLKMILSTIFCLIGGWHMVNQDFSTFSVLIFVGLFFSLIGDYYLAYIHDDEDKFIRGILAFGLAHVFYISAMIHLEGLRLREFLITMIFATLAYAFIAIKKPPLGKAKWPLCLYLLFVTFMAAKGGLMVFSHQTQLEAQWIFSVGAIMFLISDTLLGIWRYIWPKKIFSDLLSIFYFIGQVLLALAY